MLFLVNCAPKTQLEDLEEKTTCSQHSKSYSDAVKITGQGVYEYYLIDKKYRGYTNPEALRISPIRHTQVIALDPDDSETNIIQCAETDNQGNFSLAIPRGEKTYNIIILSRTDSSNGKISVKHLTQPNRAEIYGIKIEAIATSDRDVGVLKAQASEGNKLGGAFHILDEILKANAWMQEKVKGFQMREDLTVYWQYGITLRRSSYDFDRNAISIQGGGTDDEGRLVDDPDHFDKAIIVHEYAHFLEDVYGKSDSIGGAHFQGKNLDPRLSWSEGFANFFQAAVLGRSYHIDSHVEGGTFFDIEGEKCDTLLSCESGNLRPGEGNFREIKIARYLWDLYDLSDDEDVTLEFKDIWKVMTSEEEGFKKPEISFRSVGLFNQILLKLFSDEEALEDLQKTHKLSQGREHFAQPVDVGECEPFQMNPMKRIGENSFINGQGAHDDTPMWYEWMDNNDFYHYRHEGGVLDVSLVYETLSGEDTPDLNLFIYKGDKAKIFIYEKGLISPWMAPKQDLKAYTDAQSSRKPSSVGERRNIQIEQMEADHFLINVRAMSDGAPVQYELLNGDGDTLCPIDY